MSGYWSIFEQFVINQRVTRFCPRFFFCYIEKLFSGLILVTGKIHINFLIKVVDTYDV